MKAVYFPFTVASHTHLADLTACFDAVEMIQPCRFEIPASMAACIEKGFLSVRPRMADKDSRMMEAFETFQAFARLHGSQGDLKTRFFSHMEGTGGPVDEGVPSQIVSTLKKSGPDRPEKAPEDAVFAAALFLYLAQRFDIENIEVENDMKSLARTEANLFASLTGKTPSLGTGETSGSHVPEPYMASERLAAWSRLFFHGGVPEDAAAPGVWVTHSAAAAALLLERVPHPVRTVHQRTVLTAEGFGRKGGAWKTNFQKGLANALEAPVFRIPDPLVAPSVPFSGPRTLSVAVHAVPEPPSTVFKRAWGRSPLSGGQEKSAGRTLLVVLSP